MLSTVPGCGHPAAICLALRARTGCKMVRLPRMQIRDLRWSLPAPARTPAPQRNKAPGTVGIGHGKTPRTKTEFGERVSKEAGRRAGDAIRRVLRSRRRAYGWGSDGEQRPQHIGLDDGSHWNTDCGRCFRNNPDVSGRSQPAPQRRSQRIDPPQARSTRVTAENTVLRSTAQDLSCAGKRPRSFSADRERFIHRRSGLPTHPPSVPRTPTLASRHVETAAPTRPCHPECSWPPRVHRDH